MPERTSIAAALLPSPPQPTIATWLAASRARIPASSSNATGSRVAGPSARIASAACDRREDREAVAVGQRLVVDGVAAVHEHRTGPVRQSETGDHLAHGGAVSDIDGARVATALRVGLVLRQVCEECQMDGHGMSQSDPRAASMRSPARGVYSAVLLQAHLGSGLVHKVEDRIEILI